MEVPGSYEILSYDRCNISLWPSKLFAECLCSLELRLSQRRISSFPLAESPALLMYLLRLIHNDILHYTIKLELSDSGLYSLGFSLAADLRYHNSLSSGVKDTSAIFLILPLWVNMAKRSHFRKVSLLSLGWQRSTVNERCLCIQTQVLTTYGQNGSCSSPRMGRERPRGINWFCLRTGVGGSF